MKSKIRMTEVRAVASFVRPYGKRSALALILLTALIFLELAIPRLIQKIIDSGIGAHDPRVVTTTALLMLAISLVSAVFAVGNNILSVHVGESVGRDLREALFTRIQSFSFANLEELKTGELMVRLTSDVSAVQRLVLISLRIGTRAPLLMVGSLILMISTNRSLALTLLPLLIVTSLLIVFFISRMEPLFRSVQQKLDRLNTVLQENIAGIRLVKSFARADFESERFAGASEAFTDRSIRVMQVLGGMPPVLTLCVNVGIVIVIWVGGLHFVKGEMSLGQIVAFANYLLTTMTPLIMMTILTTLWAGGIASARRIGAVLNTAPAVQDEPDAIDLPETAKGRLVWENVSFRYGARGEPVLEGINLVIEPGQTVAFLGSTGAGKTTLVNLVQRFYDVTQGRILLDGIDIRNIRQESLISHIGIVPQETVLFSGTIRDNIRYGMPAANDEDVFAAAAAAQAHGFIAALPRGYDTHVEERGINLSGGQRQRIAIARALLLRPLILILDDSTSAVDIETENRIQEALAPRMGKGVTLIVTQRISTVLKADKIVVIEEGRVAAEGTHAALMQGSPLYREIFESQLGQDPPVGAAAPRGGGEAPS